MTRFSPATTLGFLAMVLRDHVDRARTSDTRGASAIEWVVISAIVVAIVIAVGIVLTEALEGKANEIGGKINDAP